MTNAEARFNKIHIRKVYACLAVTCHLHFWQNDRDFLRATVVTRGWNGYRNKNQHRKLTLEKKILPPFQQGFKPATFQSRVRCSNHWAIPAPLMLLCFGSCFRMLADILVSDFLFLYWPVTTYSQWKVYHIYIYMYSLWEFGSRWCPCTWKSPSVLNPVSQKCP